MLTQPNYNFDVHKPILKIFGWQHVYFLKYWLWMLFLAQLLWDMVL